MQNFIKISFLPVANALLLSILLLISFSAFAESRPTLTFSYQEQDIADLSVSETIGMLQLTATLSEAHPEELSFAFTLTSRTAELLRDFNFPKEITGDESGQATGATIVIPAGEKEITFSLVNIRDDIYDEADETINFFFSRAKGLTLKQTRTKITIVDDEVTPTIFLSAPGIVRNQNDSYSVALNENEGAVDLALTLLDENNRSSYEIFATFRIDQPEGVNDSTGSPDYLAPGVDNKISLRPEASEQLFQLAIDDDLLFESTETITFTLISAAFTNEKNEENPVIIHDTRNTITVTINDDDARAGAINDTGVTSCYNANKLSIDCDSRTGFPGQDQDGNQNTLSRYVKLDEAGDFLDPPESDATCIYDENTNLVWQATAENLRFSWFNQAGSINGGSDGFTGSTGTNAANCGGYAPCNTENYTEVINTLRSDTNNAEGLCNMRNWRLPRLRELVSIINFEPDESNTPPVLIDTQYFKANNGFYWTSTPSAVLSNTAWCVYFGVIEENHIQQCAKSGQASVRMVATCSPNTDPDFNNRPC